MNKKFQLWQKVIAGMTLGVFFGICFREQAQYFKPLGDIFLNMIKMVVVPLILFSILNGITNVTDAATLSRLGFRAFFMYLFTTAFAVAIGLIFANIFEPGVGLVIDLDKLSEHQHVKSIKDLLLNIVPSNPFKSMVEGNTLQIVIFAFFTGFALILIEEKGKEVRSLIKSSAFLVFEMIRLVIGFTPYGVFAIMYCSVSDYGVEIVIYLGRFIFVVLGALFAQYILFGIMLLCFARVSPLPFYKKMIKIQTLALATSSSKATLPTAISELTDKMGVSESSSSFVLPLGAAVNMDATAIYLGICAVFFSQSFGINLDWTKYAVLILTATVGSIGAAGFPGGSMVMMGMVLSSVGIPVEGIGMIMGIDRILEMIRTMINITGDCAVTLIVDKIEGTFNKKIYYSESIS